MTTDLPWKSLFGDIRHSHSDSQWNNGEMQTIHGFSYWPDSNLPAMSAFPPLSGA